MIFGIEASSKTRIGKNFCCADEGIVRFVSGCRSPHLASFTCGFSCRLRRFTPCMEVQRSARPTPSLKCHGNRREPGTGGNQEPAGTGNRRKPGTGGKREPAGTGNRREPGTIGNRELLGTGNHWEPGTTGNREPPGTGKSREAGRNGKREEPKSGKNRERRRTGNREELGTGKKRELAGRPARRPSQAQPNPAQPSSTRAGFCNLGWV